MKTEAKNVAFIANSGSSLKWNNFITEAGRADVKDTSTAKTLQNQHGEEHPENYDLLEQVYSKVPIVYGAINKTVDATVGPGFRVSCKNEQAEEIIQNLMHDWNFDQILRSVIRDILIFGTSFIELITTGATITELKPLTPKWMYVHRSNTGDIESYEQWQGGLMKPIMFKPKEILQFNYNATGNRAYGTSIISPLLKTLENQLNIERISTTIFQRKANAVWHVKLGGESGDMVFQPTQNDLDSMRSSLEDMRENQEWVTNQFCDIKVLDSQGKVMDPSNLLQFNQNQLIFGLEVPIVLMGIGNVPEGLALAQSKAFEKRVESIQQSVEAVLESQLFRRILNSQGIDEKVEFEWVSPSKEDRYKEIEVLKGLLNLAGPSQMSAFGSAPGEPLLAPDVRQQIIDRIMELMELEPSAEQAKEAEMEAPQPKVPPMEHMHQQLFESRESDNMSVHEWVGFDFKKYKENIDKFIDSQQFLEREFVTFKYLPGTQQKEWIELVANYNLAEILTEPKAEKLREILKKAFNENWSIREIAKQIENKVKPGTMDVKMPNGSEITVSNTVRALTIARVETMRAANQGALLSYAEQGVEEVSWSAALDERSCDYCDEHDGLIMSVEDADERLPAHVNCRCSPTPVIREKFATPKNR